MVARFGRAGERRARQERALPFNSKVEAFSFLREEFARRISNGYWVSSCDGTIQLDELRGLLPPEHLLTVRSARVGLNDEQDQVELRQDQIESIQIELPFGSLEQEL